MRDVCRFFYDGNHASLLPKFPTVYRAYSAAFHCANSRILALKTMRARANCTVQPSCTIAELWSSRLCRRFNYRIISGLAIGTRYNPFEEFSLHQSWLTGKKWGILWFEDIAISNTSAFTLHHQYRTLIVAMTTMRVRIWTLVYMRNCANMTNLKSVDTPY